jgi:GTPase
VSNVAVGEGGGAASVAGEAARAAGGDDARSSRPLVVIAGRPNVGKSALVNRIAGRRVAVVEQQPGVTRDRKVVPAEWRGVPFDVVDTGGWHRGDGALEAQVREQAERALHAADLVLFVVDVTTGVTDDDLVAARMVHRLQSAALLVANKVDDAGREAAMWEFVRLGLGDPRPVSALHGRGTGDLLDDVIALLAVRDHDALEHESEAGQDGALGAQSIGVPRVALVGRPNAGKSTLFNRLIGEERSIVHDLPGTTRDVVDTRVDTPEGPLCFLDTAGMRRPARTQRGTEHYAVLRALDALDRADVAVLVIDATVGPSHQDQRLAERIAAAGCPAVVVLNKWDALGTEQKEEVLTGVGERLLFLGHAPVLRVSAVTGRGVHRILPAIGVAIEAARQRIPTGMLNRALRELQSAHAAPGARIRYAVQGAVEPPTFTLFASGRLPATYLRYLDRGLRERFTLGPTPIKLRVRVQGRQR